MRSTKRFRNSANILELQTPHNATPSGIVVDYAGSSVLRPATQPLQASKPEAAAPLVPMSVLSAGRKHQPAAVVLRGADCEGSSLMDDEKLAELLEQYDDQDLETLMSFVESLGSFEEARATIEALDQLRKAA